MRKAILGGLCMLNALGIAFYPNATLGISLGLAIALSIDDLITEVRK